MHQNDLLKIQSCGAKELERLAKAYGVKPTGPRLIYGARVQAQNPHTRKVHILKRSLHTTDLRSALIKAVPMVDNWLAAVKSERAPALTVGGDKLATLAAVLAAYETVPLVKANPATRKRNAASLRAVLAVAHGELAADASSGLITRDAAEAFQRARQVAAFKEANLLRRDAMLRSANNTLKQAQSVVCRAALDDMHGLKLNTEDCRAFNARAPLPVDAPPEPEPLSNDQVGRIRAAADGLLAEGVELPVVISGNGAEAVEARVPGCSVWAAFQLMVWTGARPIEVVNAQLSWLVLDGKMWRLRLMKTEDWKPKGGGRGVPLPTRVVEQLQGLARVEGDKHIVPARTATEREWVCYRALNPWLRSLGVEEKAGHVAYRLRAYFLNLVREETLRQMDAIAVAAGAAGHADAATTMGSYVGRPSMRAPVSLPEDAAAPSA
jgi:integrase